jgi:hypothetical protein
MDQAAIKQNVDGIEAVVFEFVKREIEVARGQILTNAGDALSTIGADFNYQHLHDAFEKIIKS